MSNATSFESEEYWTARYCDATKRRGELFDWYSITFSLVKPLLMPLISQALNESVKLSSVVSSPSSDNVATSSSVFMIDLGCGNSPFLVDAAEDISTMMRASSSSPSVDCTEKSLKFIGVDFSPVVIDQQRSLLRNGYNRTLDSSVERSISFEVADCRVLCQPMSTSPSSTSSSSDSNTMNVQSTSFSLAPNSVQVVIDKATLDAMDCGDSESHSASIVQNSFALLRPGGYFVSFTCRPVARRVQTIQDAMRSVGVDVAALDVQSLRNDPISPSHMLVYQRQI